jgi:hypothetical protein
MKLENGYEEVTITVSKTIQEKPFEPLHVSVSVKKMVKKGQVEDQIRETTDMLESEICDFLGIEPEDDVPF